MSVSGAAIRAAHAGDVVIDYINIRSVPHAQRGVCRGVLYDDAERLLYVERNTYIE